MAAKDLTSKALESVDYFIKKIQEQGYSPEAAVNMTRAMLSSALESRQQEILARKAPSLYGGMPWRIQNTPYPTHYYDPNTLPKVTIDTIKVPENTCQREVNMVGEKNA